MASVITVIGKVIFVLIPKDTTKVTIGQGELLAFI